MKISFLLASNKDTNSLAFVRQPYHKLEVNNQSGKAYGDILKPQIKPQIRITDQHARWRTSAVPPATRQRQEGGIATNLLNLQNQQAKRLCGKVIFFRDNQATIPWWGSIATPAGTPDFRGNSSSCTDAPPVFSSLRHHS
jgi:hypothetical protein